MNLKKIAYLLHWQVDYASNSVSAMIDHTFTSSGTFCRLEEFQGEWNFILNEKSEIAHELIKFALIPKAESQNSIVNSVKVKFLMFTYAIG